MGSFIRLCKNLQCVAKNYLEERRNEQDKQLKQKHQSHSRDRHLLSALCGFKNHPNRPHDRNRSNIPPLRHISAPLRNPPGTIHRWNKHNHRHLRCNRIRNTSTIFRSRFSASFRCCRVFRLSGAQKMVTSCHSKHTIARRIRDKSAYFKLHKHTNWILPIPMDAHPRIHCTNITTWPQSRKMGKKCQNHNNNSRIRNPCIHRHNDATPNRRHTLRSHLRSNNTLNSSRQLCSNMEHCLLHIPMGTLSTNHRSSISGGSSNKSPNQKRILPRKQLILKSREVLDSPLY